MKQADFEGTCSSFTADQKTLLDIHQQEKPQILLEGVNSGKRFITYILDFVFIFIGAMGLGLVGALAGFGQTIDNTNEYVLGFIITLAYYVFFETLYGQSPGKMITGTIVVSEEGKKPNVGAILIQSLCRFIPFEAFSCFGDPSVGWHDSLSKTKVIKKKGYQYP